MIKIDLKDEGKCIIKGITPILTAEIATLIRAINNVLDEKPEIIRQSIEETLVMYDDNYEQICKFAYRLKTARERAEKMKAENPALFDENVSDAQKLDILNDRVENLLKELLNKIDKDKK